MSMPAGEIERIAAWNDTRTGYPRDSSLTELFAGHVAKTPDDPALTYGEIALTYRQLDRVARALAARLRELGTRRGSIVALHTDRDAATVVGMLAAVKAGAAYLPLDPAHPPARLRAIAGQARPAVLLVSSGTGDSLRLGVPAVAVAQYLRGPAADDPGLDSVPEAPAGPDDLAYVMFTSGSSGTPKGTCVTHRNVVRLVRDTNYVSFGREDKVAQISNAAFDAATFEVWGALLGGAHLIGFDRDTVLSPGKLGVALRESGITTMVMTTPLFNQIAADDPGAFACVSQLLVGGDVLAVKQAQAVAALPGVALSNGYGPTECTTFAAVHRVTSVPADQVRVPIGKPIANTTCYVLDDRLSPRPAGVPGQLYVGGDGLARCYLGHPALTADRFIPDPFAAPGSRMYATGDRVRWLPDGSLDFIGRADFQVKIRGFRIELAEVDAALADHPAVAEAVTIVTGDQAEDKALVGYYAAAAGTDVPEAEITALLARRLPEYMIPAQLIQLPRLPKNANGKIDRQKLPAPLTAQAADAGAASLDEQIAAILAELLKVTSVGLDENFFDSGGHSLLATRLLATLRTRFQADMTLGQLFDDPTARGIAEFVRAAGT